MKKTVIARSAATKQSLRLHRALLREYFSGRTGRSSPKVLRSFQLLAMTLRIKQ